ncbi:MAG: amidohydrolase family protein [Bacteroidota bacterium]
MYPIIDTHVHIWDLSRADYPWLKNNTSILNKTYTLQELEEDRKQTNVTGGILVQAAGNKDDTALMFEAAEKTNWIKGVVVWLPLMEPDTTQKLLEEKYLKEKYFKGVRHQVHDEKDPEWLLQPAVIKSLQILAFHDVPYDVVGVLPAHIETTIKVAEMVPDLRMVFDHLNQPPILKKEKFGEWGGLMKTAAQHKNLYAKISGLATASGNFNGWTNDDLLPYIEFALKEFGTDRVFFGGDWPVLLLSASYSKMWKSYQQIASKLLNELEQKKVFYTNAEMFYGL